MSLHCQVVVGEHDSQWRKHFGMHGKSLDAPTLFQKLAECKQWTLEDVRG